MNCNNNSNLTKYVTFFLNSFFLVPLNAMMIPCIINKHSASLKTFKKNEICIITNDKQKLSIEYEFLAKIPALKNLYKQQNGSLYPTQMIDISTAYKKINNGGLLLIYNALRNDTNIHLFEKFFNALDQEKKIALTNIASSQALNVSHVTNFINTIETVQKNQLRFLNECRYVESLIDFAQQEISNINCMMDLLRFNEAINELHKNLKMKINEDTKEYQDLIIKIQHIHSQINIKKYQLENINLNRINEERIKCLLKYKQFISGDNYKSEHYSSILKYSINIESINKYYLEEAVLKYGQHLRLCKKNFLLSMFDTNHDYNIKTIKNIGLIETDLISIVMAINEKNILFIFDINNIFKDKLFSSKNTYEHELGVGISVKSFSYYLDEGSKKLKINLLATNDTIVSIGDIDFR
ncbi:MAG TPA: hypothetical protein VLB80_04740 [Candidatus Babeliales bacterium]|nr:hypothetical protein [Candidatus Babeliales bacterium]